MEFSNFQRVSGANQRAFESMREEHREALTAFPFRRLDVAEFAPGVIEAARSWFSDVNGDVMDKDPRVHLLVADGRNHLLLSSDRYDLITIEVTCIWISGEADVCL